MRNKKIICLCEAAIMCALAFALSYVKLWQMPLGGSVTLGSMLPIILISVKYGIRVGVPTAFVYSLTQLFQGFTEGTLYFAMEVDVLIIAILFDYIVPFTLLGFSGIFKAKREAGIYIGTLVFVFLRFISHYCTGVTIWKQWTPDGWSSYLYSAAYNGGFLLFDFLIAMVLLVLLLRVREMRKLLSLN
jgi:thiamine transporter